MIDDRWSYQAWSGMLILITLVVALNVCVRIAGSRRKFNAA